MPYHLAKPLFGADGRSRTHAKSSKCSPTTDFPPINVSKLSSVRRKEVPHTRHVSPWCLSKERSLCQRSPKITLGYTHYTTSVSLCQALFQKLWESGSNTPFSASVRLLGWVTLSDLITEPIYKQPTPHATKTRYNARIITAHTMTLAKNKR